MNMSQTEEFVKVVQAAKKGEGSVIFVVGKPGSGKSKVLREAAQDMKWDYLDCRMLISEEFSYWLRLGRGTWKTVCCAMKSSTERNPFVFLPKVLRFGMSTEAGRR